MRPVLIAAWKRIADSYWAVPTLMCLAASLLALVLTRGESYGWFTGFESVGMFSPHEPSGARAVLAAIAGSMITVASLTFSMTLVAISYAAGSVGPRLLNNFMRDRGNQFTLGVFVSTFLYSLLVLRTIREAGGEQTPAFVPGIAVLVGMILAVASIGVLVFFIHHIPESIHISNIVARVGRDIRREIEGLFPGGIGFTPDDDERSTRDPDPAPDPTPFRPPAFEAESVPVLARGSGYVQLVDDERLFEIAVRDDLVIDILIRPGAFVLPGQTLLRVYPAENLEPDIVDELRGAYVQGNERTGHQNLRFMFDQLVEVGGRALSPGINDPFTANLCVDQLAAGLLHLDRVVLPGPRRVDANDELRILARPATFEEFASATFDQLRPYVATDVIATRHVLCVIADLIELLRVRSHRRCLRRHGRRLLRHAAESLTLTADAEALRVLYRSAVLKDRERRRNGA